MEHNLFLEIDKFDNWARNLSQTPQEERYGEWECDYNDWDGIYKSFEDFLTMSDPSKWTKYQKVRLLYIIARDNELGILSRSLSEHQKALIFLTEESIANGQKDDKWQLATQLHKISDRELAIKLLDQLVNAEEEYVNRIALMEMAKLHVNTVELYCELFWNRFKYIDEDEYQKMAVLQALKDIKSPKLNMYLELARKDGRKHLLKLANELTRKVGHRSNFNFYKS